jgi:hypothetical protein
MRSEILRPSGLVLAAVILGSCDSEQPLEPTGRGNLSAVPANSNIVAPSNLTATAQEGNRIRLSWRDNSSNEKGFELLRSLTGPSGALELYVKSLAAGSTNYVDTGVEPVTTYCYAVRAFKVAGATRSYSALSPIACATTPPATGAPSAPSATGARPSNSSTIWVSWTDNSQDETGFQIERGATVSGPWITGPTLGPNLSSGFDGGRASETQVCYRVAAYNANGRSAWSAAVCTIPPAGPTNLRVASATPIAVDLAWSDNSAVEDGYEIERAPTYDGPYLVIAPIATNSTTYHDPGLQNDQSYWYRVRAKRAGGFSDYAGPIAAVPATTLPVAPTWVSASPSPDASNMHLYWTDNSANEAGYRVDRSEGGGPWITRATFGPDAAGLWDVIYYPTPLPIEVEICYRVVAFNALGESSDTLCTGLPAVPIDLSARLVNGVVELSWTDNSRFEDGYYIVRADDSSMSFYYIYDAVGPNVTTYRDEHFEGWASYYLRAIKGPEGYTTCCSNGVDVFMPWSEGP